MFGMPCKEVNKELVVRMEDEVKMAELEASLRRLIIELVRPAVSRVEKALTDVEDLKTTVCESKEAVLKMNDEIEGFRENTDMIADLKRRLEDTQQRLSTVDTRLTSDQNAIGVRVEGCEQRLESQGHWNKNTEKALERVSQDFETVHNSLKRLAASLDLQIGQARDFLNSEVKSLRVTMKEMDEELHQLNAEVWGPEDFGRLDETRPPSLRRLDLQARHATQKLQDLSADVEALRKLDANMTELGEEHSLLKGKMGGVVDLSEHLREKVDEVAAEAKLDSQSSANRMAAFAASLARDVRRGVEAEVVTLRKMQSEVETRIADSSQNSDGLRTSFQSLAAHLEAHLNEVHSDLSDLGTKRKKDKLATQEALQTMQLQVSSSLDATETTLRGLEHVSSVLSMSLQGHRISIALDVQDYLERRDTGYVVVRETAHASRVWEARGRPGLDPTTLERLQYQPAPVAFQGSAFERPQLHALRERVVHTAQDLLQKGPAAKPSKHRMASAIASAQPAGDIVPSMLNATVPMMPLPRAPSGQGHARPGSRGQPSARGSPLPDQGPAGRSMSRGTPDEAPQSEGNDFKGAFREFHPDGKQQHAAPPDKLEGLPSLVT